MGGAKSMVMGCMSGTAIIIENLKIVLDDYEEGFQLLFDMNIRVGFLKTLILEQS